MFQLFLQNGQICKNTAIPWVSKALTTQCLYAKDVTF